MNASTSSIECSSHHFGIVLIKLPTCRASPAGIAKGFKQRGRERILQHVPFGVPLHRQREVSRATHVKRLYQTIRCARLDLERFTQAIHALLVQGIDLQPLARRRALRARHSW